MTLSLNCLSLKSQAVKILNTKYQCMMENQITIFTISAISLIPLSVYGSLLQDDPILIESK